MSSDQNRFQGNRREGGAGDTPFSVYSTAPLDALSYYVNTLFKLPTTERQRNAVDLLTNSEKKTVQKKVQEVVAEELPTFDVSGSSVPQTISRPSISSREINSSSNSNPPSTSIAGNNSTSGRNPPSTSTSLGRRIAEILMEDISDDAKETKRMEMEREMNVAGRKKGGMAKKKKAPVKKAYGGMVKKKQGGSARKVNMKAGFTRRGCSKG